MTEDTHQPIPAFGSDTPVETVEVVNTVILNPDGTTTLVGSTREIAVVLPDGGHRYERTTARVTTLDGHVLDAEHGDTAHHCPQCGIGPYSRHVMSTCASCQRYVCRACTAIDHAAILCTTCHAAIKKQAVKAFFLRIT